MCNCEGCIRYWSSDEGIHTACDQMVHHAQHGERTVDHWMKVRNHHSCDNGICNIDRPHWNVTIKTLIGLDVSFLSSHRLMCDGCRAIRFYANRYNSALHEEEFVMGAIERNTLQIQDVDVADVIHVHRDRNRRVALINGGIAMHRLIQYSLIMHNIVMSGVSLVCVGGRTLCELEHDTHRDVFGEWRCDIAPQQYRLHMTTRLDGIKVKMIRNVVEAFSADEYLRIRVDPIFLDPFVNLEHLRPDNDDDINDVVYL